MSPNSALTSLEMRFEAVTYLKDGKPMAVRMPMMVMVMTSSVTVKPAVRPCRGDVFMGAILRREPCTKLTEASPEPKINVMRLTQCRGRRERATPTPPDSRAPAPRLRHLTLAEFHRDARSDAVRTRID